MHSYSDRVVLEPVGFLEPFDRQATTTSYFTWIFQWRNVLYAQRPVWAALEKIPCVYLYTVHLLRKSHNVKLHMVLLCVTRSTHWLVQHFREVSHLSLTVLEKKWTLENTSLLSYCQFHRGRKQGSNPCVTFVTIECDAPSKWGSSMPFNVHKK